MHIHALRLVDWMPFAGEHCLEGIPAAPLAVLARYIDNPRRSNWAGKTSLLEAIGWCLFGAHRKRLEDGLIHRGAKECVVEVRLTGNVLVERRRPRGGPTKLRVVVVHAGPVDAETEQVETLEGEAAQQMILSILRMSYEDTVATTTFTQGDTEALVGKVSGERRKIISRWLELDLWERAGAGARTKLREAQAALQALSSIPEEPVGRTGGEVAVDQAAAEQQVQALVQQLAGVEIQLEVWRVANEGAGLEGELTRCLEEGRALKKVLHATPVVPADEVEQARARVQAAQQHYGVAHQEHQAAQALVQQGFDGKCPVTRGECPAAESVRCAGTVTQQRLTVAHQDFMQMEAESRDVLGVLRELEAKVQQRAALVERFNDAVSRARRLTSQVEERMARFRAAGDVDGAGLESQVRQLTTAVAEARAVVQALKHEAREVQGRLQRQQARATAVVVAERKVRVAQLAQKALGPSGIPAKISAQSLGVLAERGNALLSGTGLSFSLSWEREGKDLTPSCYDCGYAFRGQREKSCPGCSAPRGKKRAEELEVLVEDGSGEVEDVRAKSGGARALVASAIRLAGGMLLRERRGSRIAWAEVDEPFGALDAENRAGLARCFTSMLGSVGLEQAFIVSHDAALLEALPARIVITREGNTSRLSLEV